MKMQCLFAERVRDYLGKEGLIEIGETAIFFISTFNS